MSWTDYIDTDEPGAPGTVERFAQSSQLEVDYSDEYPSNTEAFSDLFAPNLGRGRGVGFDIVVPTFWLASRLVDRDWLEPLPLELVPNHTNLEPTFLTMPWEPALPEELELSRFASFTLPLSLPRAGGGLLVWESVTSVDVDEHAAARDLRQWEATEELTCERPAVHHAYATGTLVVHSGHVVHQIAPWELAAGDARVTLQGHALFHQDEWQVYW